jgi:hypothetical protein
MSKDIKLTEQEIAQVEYAQEWVDRQAAALDKVREPLLKLDAGKPLSRRDRLVLAEEFGLHGEELDKRHAADPNQTMIDNVLREPVASFMIDRDGEEHEVRVRPNGEIEVT